MIGRGLVWIAIVSSMLSLPSRADASTKMVSAAETIKRIEGVYKNRFANSTVQDEHFQSEDILEIVSYSANAIYFRVHLEFYNGHTCDLSGIAAYENGSFVFHGTSDVSDAICKLTIKADSGNVTLDDVGGNCRTYSCGARGGYHDVSFPIKSRRVIKYLKRLTASHEYADAAADYAKTQAAHH
jgi:hypothetical protein